MSEVVNSERLNNLIQLVERCAPLEHINQTPINNLIFVRESTPHDNRFDVYGAGFVFWLCGRKEGVFGTTPFELSNGSLLVTCLPLPLETKLIEASVEAPALGVAIQFDLTRVVEMLVRLDTLAPQQVSVSAQSQACLVQPLDERFLDALIRLISTLDNAAEVKLLAPLIIDEIYFHLLTNAYSGELCNMLRHRGQVQVIAPAVQHIYKNLDKVVSVDQLASTVNMSTPHFRRVFRGIMQMPPLQYAKMIKLDRAQLLLQQGESVNRVAHQVGYKSVPQFSREYRRQYGYAPSN